MSKKKDLYKYAQNSNLFKKNHDININVAPSIWSNVVLKIFEEYPTQHEDTYLKSVPRLFTCQNKSEAIWLWWLLNFDHDYISLIRSRVYRGEKNLIANNALQLIVWQNRLVSCLSMIHNTLSNLDRVVKHQWCSRPLVKLYFIVYFRSYFPVYFMSVFILM